MCTKFNHISRIVLLFIGWSCGVFSSPGWSADVKPVPNTVSSSYHIGPQDQVSVNVFQQEALSVEVLVGPDGTVDLALVGEIKIGGLTRQEAKNLIIQAYKKYLVDPQVELSISAYNGFQVKVLGLVNNPGVYPLRGARNTLLQAVAQAGGTSPNAQLRQVTILRSAEEIMEVDLYQILYEGKIGLDVPLMPEDTVFIPDSRNTRVIVMGQVNTPGIVDINSQLTVLEAIMKAGGYIDGAKLRDVWVIRSNAAKPEVLHMDISKQLTKGIAPKNQILKAGDIVYVHRGIVAELNYLLDQTTPAMRTILLGDSVRNVFKGQGTNVQTTISN
jgi:polysaccharide export outer membrane protein